MTSINQTIGINDNMIQQQQAGKNMFSSQKEEVDTSNQQEQSSRGRGRDSIGIISFQRG